MHIRKDYTVLPGDTYTVRILARGILLDRFTQNPVVAPDGNVTLLDIEKPMNVTGLTMVEFQQEIREAYEAAFPEMTTTDIEVALRLDSSEKVVWFPDSIFATGELYRPGVFSYRKGMTFMQLVSMSGGFRDTAWTSRVVLMRVVDGKSVTREVDAKAMIQHAADDIQVFPGDVVFVPRTRIATADIWVMQYVRSFLIVDPFVVLRFYLISQR
jgi:protein involved in polysaccharide export with SLBB domain